MSTSFFQLSVSPLRPGRVPVSRTRRSVSTQLRAARQHFFSTCVRSAFASRTSAFGFPKRRSFLANPARPVNTFFSSFPCRRCGPDPRPGFPSRGGVSLRPATGTVNTFFQRSSGNRFPKKPPRFPAARDGFYGHPARASTCFLSITSPASIIVLSPRRHHGGEHIASPGRSTPLPGVLPGIGAVTGLCGQLPDTQAPPGSLRVCLHRSISVEDRLPRALPSTPPWRHLLIGPKPQHERLRFGAGPG